MPVCPEANIVVPLGMEPALEIRHVAGGIVLGDGGTIAMVKTRGGDGSFLFPKGHLEEGEDDESAARREVAEETGLRNLELLDDLGTYERPRMKKDGADRDGTLKLLHMYLFAAPPHSVLSPSMEIEEALWVPYQKVAQTIGNDKDRAWFSSVFERVRQAIQRD